MKPASAKRPAAPGLFSSSNSPDLIIYIDGGSRGNPGPAGYGVVVQDGAGRTLHTISQAIGTATNNVAEYSALLAALEHALQHDAGRTQIYCDSELVVRQMQGRYRVQSPDLLPLYRRAREMAGRLEQFTITHVPRERNSQADELANRAMDAAMGQSRSGGQGNEARSASAPAAAALVAVCENGLLRLLPPAPALEEGALYEVRLRKRR
jgi:probable phosphoglycerate mutase